LGEESLEEHKSIVELVIKNKSVTTYFIGKDFFANEIQNENCYFFLNFEDFAQRFNGKVISNSLLLIKGSRGMALERTLSIL
jgi:UDP-N-acetylmuramoyl-tripeptide--D-alanyl-D-alanine ligase